MFCSVPHVFFPKAHSRCVGYTQWYAGTLTSSCLLTAQELTAHTSCNSTFSDVTLVAWNQLCIYTFEIGRCYKSEFGFFAFVFWEPIYQHTTGFKKPMSWQKNHSVSLGWSKSHGQEWQRGGDTCSTYRRHHKSYGKDGKGASSCEQ